MISHKVQGQAQDPIEVLLQAVQDYSMSRQSALAEVDRFFTELAATWGASDIPGAIADYNGDKLELLASTLPWVRLHVISTSQPLTIVVEADTKRFVLYAHIKWTYAGNSGSLQALVTRAILDLTCDGD